MRKFLSVATIGLGLTFSDAPAALAHEGHEHPSDAKATAQLPLVAGEVTKIDESAGKITLKHGAIPNLGMPERTMVFNATDPAMLKDVRPGDKIKFTADKVNGQLTVMKMEKAK